MSENLPILKDLLSNATIRLQGAGIENPRFASEIIMRHLLKLRRIDLYLDPERTVSTKEAEEFEQNIQRKLSREPLQYILGETEWFGLIIRCDHRALIPRPETEIVVERALHRLAGLKNPRVVDIGTGTGCIAIAIARAKADAEILATDISTEALALARENMVANGVERQIELKQSDLFSVIADENRFDLIISNPPYISTSDYPGLMPEVRDFEPITALTAGEKGLDIITLIMAQAKAYLKLGGFLVLEVGMGQVPRVKEIAEERGYLGVTEVISDYNKIERGIVFRRSR